MYKLRAIDITKVNADAIVNSLGVDTTTYGRICACIVTKAKSAVLVKQISSWKNVAQPGMVFVTPGYSLPSKHIIHVVTPYYEHDRESDQIEDAYRNIFLTILKNEWKDVALPIIGTGANKYPHSIILKLLLNMTEAFCKAFPDIKITICNPVSSYEDYEKEFNEDKLKEQLLRFVKENEILTFKTFKYSKNYFILTSEQQIKEIEENRKEEIIRERRFRSDNNDSKQGFITEDDILLDGGNRPVKIDYATMGEKSVRNYLEKYIQIRYSAEPERKRVFKLMKERAAGSVENAASFYAKLGGRKKRNVITINKLMRYILALHMTLEEAKDLLTFCGKTFSPVDNDDKIYEELIKIKLYDLYKINAFCYSNGSKWLFPPQEPSE